MKLCPPVPTALDPAVLPDFFDPFEVLRLQLCHTIMVDVTKFGSFYLKCYLVEDRDPAGLWASIFGTLNLLLVSYGE